MYKETPRLIILERDAKHYLMDTQSVLRTWNTFWYLLCANEKINESRSKYALTTSLTLNYSFMLKCCKRSPIIWFNENACNGMHAANKLICTSYFNSIYWEVLWLYIFAVWSLFIQKHYNVNFSCNSYFVIEIWLHLQKLYVLDTYMVSLISDPQNIALLFIGD